jgi:hypothetical protein
MIDFSEKSYLKIRWNPEYKMWFNAYLYYTRDKRWDRFDKGRALIGIKSDAWEIQWREISDIKGVAWVCEVVHLPPEAVYAFIDFAGHMWDKYETDRDIGKELVDMKYRIMKADKAEERIAQIKKEYHDKYMEMREEWTRGYSRIMQREKADIVYFGGEKAYSKIDPEIRNIRHLQLSLLREARKIREEAYAKG